MAEFFGSTFVASIITFAIAFFFICTPIMLFFIAYAIEEKATAIEKLAKAMSKIALFLKKLANSITQSWLFI